MFMANLSIDTQSVLNFQYVLKMKIAVENHHNILEYRRCRNVETYAVWFKIL